MIICGLTFIVILWNILPVYSEANCTFSCKRQDRKQDYIYIYIYDYQVWIFNYMIIRSYTSVWRRCIWY